MDPTPVDNRDGHVDHSNPYRPRLQHESRVAAFGADKFTVGASQTPRGSSRFSPSGGGGLSSTERK